MKCSECEEDLAVDIQCTKHKAQGWCMTNAAPGWDKGIKTETCLRINTQKITPTWQTKPQRRHLSEDQLLFQSCDLEENFVLAQCTQPIMV